MNPAQVKLVRQGLDPGVAQRLIEAGYRNPASIRAASDKDLRAVPGIKASNVDDIREKIG